MKKVAWNADMFLPKQCPAMSSLTCLLGPVLKVKVRSVDGEDKDE